MTSRKQSAQSINDSAAQWAVRLDADRLSADEKAALQIWLDSDRRCLGALARAQAVLLGPGDRWAVSPAFPARVWPSRRLLLGGAAGSLATAGLGLVVWPQLSQKVLPLYVRSERGEVRHLPLPDGSKLTLNTETALDVEFSRSRRLIRLLRGEVFFEVAKDAERPFIVTGPKAQVRTVGTSYAVRLTEAASMHVLVATGRVAIERVERSFDPIAAFSQSRDPGQAVFVNAGQEARIWDTGTDGEALRIAIDPVSAERSTRALLWRQGRLYFEDVTLAEAAREFERYSYRRIVIRNAALARTQVSGLFAADDPEGFARAVALSLNARAVVRNDVIALDK